MDTYMENAAHDWTEDSVRIIATPSQLAKSTFYYVQEIGHFMTRPHYYTERKHLHSYLIVYTLSGMGYLHYRGKDYTVGPGQVFFIDCREYQLYKTDSRHAWEILWVHFEGSSSRGYYEQFAKHGSPVVAPENPHLIGNIIHNLLQLHRSKDIRTETLSSKYIVDLLTQMLLATNPAEGEGAFLPSVLEQVVRDLNKRFHEPISLDQLSKQHAISKFHLVRQFKKYTGFTPHEYVINCRITYAKELLTYSDLTVAEIAARTGIHNVSHFINLFKQRAEMTPLAYRKKWKPG